MTQPITIREARCGDAAGIARVHVDSWRTTYRGIVPDDYLANLSAEQRERHWHSVTCCAASDEFVYVAEDPVGQIVGFASGAPERTGHAEYKGELYAIYLLAEYQKRGIGRRLVSAVAARLLRNGFHTMLLWVLANNPARHFYEALGGQAVISQPITIGGVALEEVAYGWKDLTTLQ